MMSAQKPTPIPPFLFLIILTLRLSYSVAKRSIIFCPEIEKKALTSFKQSLEDPFNQLSSWNSEVNCCNWKGVVCSNFTGHVHQLRLRNRDYPNFSGLRGKVNITFLLNLERLRYLDLSQNNFGERIPFFIGALASLEYLNLSNAGFHGTVPYTVGNLSNLHTLSLEDSSLDVDNLEWLSGLSQLEHLNMNGVNIGKKGANWVQVINTLPSLEELHFEYCRLNAIAPLNDHVINVSSLVILDLSHNEFESFVVPRWIFQLDNLVFLDLSNNSFEGPLPNISSTVKLQYIDLSSNHFNSTIPVWLYFCKDLEFVSLRLNSLKGTISAAIANLTSLNTFDVYNNGLFGKLPKEVTYLCNIKKLHLAINKFQGNISDSFGNMSDCFLESLVSLHLWSNQFSGVIPSNFGMLSSLKELRIGRNELTGNLPESLGKLSSMEFLGFASNLLEGVVTESHLANLTKLNWLSAFGNRLTLKVHKNWIPPFKLKTLTLGSWNLGVGRTQIPIWLETQKNSLYELDLSNIGISGQVPNWFWGIRVLDISQNNLHGKIPYIRSGFVDLHSNQFNGSLPRVANNVTALDLSNNSFSGGLSHFLCDTTRGTYTLEFLHLGGNQLTGKIPDCWMMWPSLRVMNLGNNKLFGRIPNSIGFPANLLSLNLYINKLSGNIPLSLHNCTKLLKIDFANNSLDGDIPTWMGTSLASLRILILRSNKLSGKISSHICHLYYLQILDLSNNKFSGIIPRCVNNFTAMATIRSNLVDNDISYAMYIGGILYLRVVVESASVFTKGSESHYDNTLSLVTNIDLSRNNLSGNIPEELTSLVELRSLNLSGNRLVGLIPNRIGNMKQLESLDFSRNSLSGRIPNSFTIMSSLNHLNLSYNNLTGRIPKSTQLLSLDASSFLGNQLCGPPLPINCSSDDLVPVPVTKKDNEGNKPKIDWLCVFVSLGYAVGFSVVCTTLVFIKSWRDAYFGFFEDMWNKIYLFFYIKWRRLARR